MIGQCISIPALHEPHLDAARPFSASVPQITARLKRRQLLEWRPRIITWGAYEICNIGRVTEHWLSSLKFAETTITLISWYHSSCPLHSAVFFQKVVASWSCTLTDIRHSTPLNQICKRLWMLYCWPSAELCSYNFEACNVEWGWNNNTRNFVRRFCLLIIKDKGNLNLMLTRSTEGKLNDSVTLGAVE